MRQSTVRKILQGKSLDKALVVSNHFRFIDREDILCQTCYSYNTVWKRWELSMKQSFWETHDAKKCHHGSIIIVSPGRFTCDSGDDYNVDQL